MRLSTGKPGRKAALSAALLLVLAGGAGGCEGQDVWVGQLQEGLDLDVCSGEGTDCGPGVSTEEMTTPALRTCDSEIQPELAVDFSVDLLEHICPVSDLSCDADIVDIGVSPDGSSWVVGFNTIYGNQPNQTIWVSHFDDEGEVLETVVFTTNNPFTGALRQHEVDLAVDARGHAFLVVYQVEQPDSDSPFIERAWLTEINTHGVPREEPIFLAGIGAAHVAIREEGKAVIAANALQNAPHGVLAAVTTSGERLWSQTNVPSTGQNGEGIADLAIDAAGDAFVLAARRSFSDGNKSVYGLARYDANGNPVWDRSFDRRFGYGHVVPAGDGSVLVNGKPHDDENSFLWHVLDEGSVDWAYMVPVANPNAPLYDPSTGTAYITGFDVEESSRFFLIAISEDGESCARYAMTADAYSPVGFDDQGRMFAFGFNTLIRLQAPEE